MAVMLLRLLLLSAFRFLSARAPLCTPVPEVPDLTVWVDQATIPAELDPAAVLAAVDAGLEPFGMVRVDEGGDLAVRWVSWLGAGTLGGETCVGGCAVVFSDAVLWSVGATCPAGSYDWPTVLAHEMGHVAGLVHTPSGLMREAIAPCERRRACGAVVS